MFKLLQCFFTICLVQYSLSTTAANIPQNELDAQQFKAEQCIDENTQLCINNQCLTSETTDCQEQCATLAKGKCAAESD